MIPIKMGNNEISVYDKESLNISDSISAIKPIRYNIMMLANDTTKGTQKDLLTKPPLIIK